MMDEMTKAESFRVNVYIAWSGLLFCLFPLLGNERRAQRARDS
jgi:hypothetical protein